MTLPKHFQKVGDHDYFDDFLPLDPDQDPEIKSKVGDPKHC
jgi:hypothetical protein